MDLGMSTTQKARVHRVRRSARIALVVLALYVSTVGIVQVVFRYVAGSTHLQWLRSMPGALPALEAYEQPARILARVPVLAYTVGLSYDFWYFALEAPDTTP